MLDHKLLKQARENISKEAFNPMTPEAQAAAAQQGAAPMDPAMAGGAPPMDPAMMGMDPAMMGGAPPMDPAMMGGAPPMDPAMMGMDPAMMGGMPPLEDALAGGAPPMEDPAAAGTPVTLNLEDLKLVISELQGEGGEGAPESESKRVTNKDIMAKMQTIEESLQALAAATGVQLPAGDVGVGGDTSIGGEAAAPEDIAAVAAGMEDPAMGGMDPMMAAMESGMPPGEFPSETMPKMAMDHWSRTKVAGK